MARRAVAQGRRSEVLDPPSSAAALANHTRMGADRPAFTTAEVAELAAGIDPPDLKHLTADARYAHQRAEQDRLRLERNAADGHPEPDPCVLATSRPLQKGPR